MARDNAKAEAARRAAEAERARQLQARLDKLKAAGMVVAGSTAGGASDAKGSSELDALRSLIRCNVCRSANKDTAITRCMHVFCRGCVDERLESRNRKCPQCSTVFASSDVRPIYFA